MTATAPAVAAKDEFTVAGLIRRLAQAQPGHEMLVAGDVRRTWSEEYERDLSGSARLPPGRSVAR